LEKIEKELMKVSTTRSKHDILTKKKNRGTKVPPVTPSFVLILIKAIVFGE
jgi:hypothetical protein